MSPPFLCDSFETFRSSTSVISESLGHSSERVTQIYLDSFENRQLNDAMKNLL